MNFVMDASVALVWLAPSMHAPGLKYADAVLNALTVSQAVVPTLFRLEVGNVIARLEAKAIVTEAESRRFLALLADLDITTDSETVERAWGDTLNLARRYKLSSYDAAYLELALRTGLPVATLDADLANASVVAGVVAFSAEVG
ncbi:MAG: type II toxin-antitoxin system VapC family toxin [Betaproteobacteria bacterium]|nr:type II toxin-antitoxin system VapC family toxin [Betaproteobacteria bacterium]